MPEKRYHSAAEMRNAIEKLCPLYNWKIVEDDYWRGEAIGYPIKDVYAELKRNYIGLIVTNNCRKSSQDSEKFSNLFEARQYMMEYIKNTTLQ